MIRSFVINLDSAEARRRHMEAQFERLGLRYERVPAVDGHAEDVAAIVAQSSLTAGEIGNFFSHARLWERIATMGEDYAAIFEDDVYLSPALPRFLADSRWIPGDADVVKIETMAMSANFDRHGADAGGGFRIRRLRSTHWGVAGYVISAAAARRLSAANMPLSRPADHVLFNLDEAPLLNPVVYQLDPALCIQHDVLSLDHPGSSLSSAIQPERASHGRPKTVSSRVVSELKKIAPTISRLLRRRVVRKRIPFAQTDGRATTVGHNYR
jgi:glycosyl transferase family 25